MRGLTFRGFALCVLGASFFSQAHASISLSANRLVFEERADSASLYVRNEGEQEVLVQSWLEADADNGVKAIPFVVTPSFARLAGKGRQVLRVLYQGSGVPENKESVLWLSVQEIPQAAEQENTLQLAVRQRIKVFYRPQGLKGKPDLAPAQLGWRLVKQGNGVGLQVSNPSVYHVSLPVIEMDNKGDKQALQPRMFKPGETVLLPTQLKAQGDTVIVRYKSVNDWGAQIAHEVVVDFAKDANAA